MSEDSQSRLFNSIVNRDNNEIGRAIGEELVWNAVGSVAGAGLGKALGYVGGYVWGKIAGRVAEKAAKGGKSFFDGAKYSTKVLEQMDKADDLFHAFPKSVDGYAAKFGQYTIKVGADGKTYQWLKIPGSYGGKSGTFEYIKDVNGLINHRFFNVP